MGQLNGAIRLQRWIPRENGAIERNLPESSGIFGIFSVQFVGKMGQLNGAIRLRRLIRRKNGAIERCNSIAAFNS